MNRAVVGSLDDVRRVCHEVGQEVLEPARAETDAGVYPRRGLAALASVGMGAITVGEEYGGLGLSYEAFTAAVEVIASYCASTAMVYVMHTGAVETVKLAGSDSQKATYLAGASEGRIGSLAFSEPGTGGHFWYCTSQAARDGDGYVLVADKSFVTSAGEADWYVMQTRSPDSDAPENMSYFLIDGGSPGINTPFPWDALGLRGNSSGPMRFEDVRVKEEAVLGNHGDAAYWNDNAVDPVFLLGSSACWLGIATGAFERAVEHTKRTVHKDFNHSIGEYQVVRSYVADMSVKVAAARALTYEVARALDGFDRAGQPLGSDLEALWRLKILTSKTVIEVTNLALQVSGGRGYRRGAIEQAYRDGRAGAIMGPTNEMCAEWIAKTALDMPLGYWYEGKDV